MRPLSARSSRFSWIGMLFLLMGITIAIAGIVVSPPRGGLSALSGAAGCSWCWVYSRGRRVRWSS